MTTKDEIRSWAIYKITSPTGRLYIGKTSDFTGRMASYKRGKAQSQKLLFKSLTKYGFDAHKVEKIDQFESDNNYANGKEMFWIRSFMTHIHSFPEQGGMNLTLGGDGVIGRFIPEKEKERIRSMSYIRNGLPSPRIGLKHSEESRVKMAISQQKRIQGKTHWNVGKERSPETREKLRQINVGKSLGRVYSGDTLERIRIGGLAKQKPVSQYSLDGEFISNHSGMSAASRATGVPLSTIKHIVAGTIPKPKKFIFKLN